MVLVTVSLIAILGFGPVVSALGITVFSFGRASRGLL